MKKRILFKSWILFFLLCIIYILAGCGKANEEDATYDIGNEESVSAETEAEEAWVIDRHEVYKENEDEIWNGLQYHDGVVYYTSHTWDNVSGLGPFSLIRMTNDTTECLITLEAGTRIESYQIDSEGSIYIFAYTQVENGVNYELLKVDEQGTLIFRKESPTVSANLPYMVNIPNAEASEEGFCTMTGFGMIMVWDNQGNEVGIIPPEWLDGTEGLDFGLVKGEEGIYAYHCKDIIKSVNDEYKTEIIVYFQLLDMETGTLSEEYSMELRIGEDEDYELHDTSDRIIFYSGYDQGFYISDAEALYLYDDQTKHMEKLMPWAGPYMDINRNQVEKIKKEEQGTILLNIFEEMTWTWENYWFVKHGRETAKREEITIGEFYYHGTDAKLTECARSFNASQEKYVVSIVEYDTDNLTVFDLDLLQGKGPDLICLDKIDRKKYASKGILEDLAPYLREGGDLTEDMLLPSIKAAITEEEKIRFIFPVFSLRVMVMQEEYAVEETFTTEEFLKLGVTGEDHYLLPEVKYGLFEKLLLLDKEHYLDWSEGTCFFNDGRFARLLEQIYRSNLPGSYDTLKASQDFYEGIYLAKYDNLDNFIQYLVLRDGLEGVARIMGYPNEKGEVLYPITSQGAIGINSASDHKEGAWEFLKFYMHHYNDHSAEKLDMGGFRALEEDFEKQLVKVENLDETTVTMTDPYSNEAVIIIGQNEKVEGPYYKHPVSGETLGRVIQAKDTDYEMMRYMVEHAYLIDEILERDLEAMFMEEVQSYFGNGKSAEEVAEIIQRKVSLYMSEQVW